jgi:hypothetical protein
MRSRELRMLKTTVWHVLHLVILYIFTMSQTLEPEDFPKRKNFCETLQAEMDTDETTAQRLVFSNEATFHTSGKVNRHNVCVHACNTATHATVGHQCDSSKVNAMSRSQV